MPETQQTTKLPAGELIPILGQGTWHMGENRGQRADEIASLREGIALGMTLIDTAELYADGESERIVAEAIDGKRDDVFLVTKVLPSNASYTGTLAACDRSLKRLRTDRVDLYLLHWPGPIPLEETLDAFNDLIHDEKIRFWGVSNVDRAEMSELVTLDNGHDVQTDQVLYNLSRRNIEWELLPWCREHHLPIMAYSPIEQGRVLGNETLCSIAAARGVSPAQVALAWVLRQPGMCAIPKASTPDHVRENHAALELTLTDEELTALDRAFPAPTGPQPLDVI